MNTTATIQGYRLSPQQKHLWLLQQLEQDSPYIAQCAIQITGELNIEIFKTALENVVLRHEILRTHYRCLPGMEIPLQVIAEKGVSWEKEYNFSGLDSESEATEIEKLFHEFLQKPYNLEQDSPFRVGLISFSPQKHILLVQLPALSADAITLNNLVGEISRNYTAGLQGEELDDEPLQYADFAEWQNELLEAEDTEAGREYWRNQDISNISSYQLPFERLNGGKFKPQSITLTLPSDLVEKLESFSQKYEVSASVFLLTCWQVLLWRILGQSDLIIGTAFAGRKYEDLEQALGLFAKFLPVRFSFDHESKFREVLLAVKDSIDEVYKWQEYFNWEEVNNKIRQHYFAFSFDFLEQLAVEKSAEISFSMTKQSLYIDRFRVKLSGVKRADSLIVEFHYDSGLIDEEVIQQLAREFETLLGSAVKNPEAAVGELEILSERDRIQLLVEFNQTNADFPPTQCIHQLFETQAAQTPDSIAVVFENQQLTYAQLNAQANQLAHYLRRLGVTSEVIVPICLERSLEIMVSILGVLKAGGAYLPLDPSLPSERLAYILQDAQARIFITQQHQVDDKFLTHSSPITTLYLDQDWDAISQEPDENPNNQTQPENLVYAIYTSGSTGKPKGVAVEHQQLFNYINAILNKLELPTGASFALVSTFAADLGNTAIFPCLCTGGCLHIISQELATNPEALADYFRRHPIDCLKIVPSHLKALLTASDAQSILPRQRLVLGGEASRWELIEKVQKLAPTCRILNHYGPTEATVGVTTFTIDEFVNNNSPLASPLALDGKGVRGEGGLASLPSPDFTATVPLGRPLANTQVYVLDKHQQPVPIGVPGELHISGKGLVRGYLNHPDLTTEKFIPNPFSKQSESKLYKTGDLVRYLPDGNIEFLGRIDHQVKIRGFRIELGEIESALRHHPDVREAVVLAREDEPGNKRLVAYIVLRSPSSNSSISSSIISNFLKEKLPDYMVPSAFVILKMLPLTPNGKIDRQALPTPSSISPELFGTLVAPRTLVEKQLAKIWSNSLGLEKVGIHDNFFELGGDSIISMQIIARANQAGLQLNPRQLFQHQTIAELAKVVGTAVTIQAEQGIVSGIVPLTPIQHWFFEQNLCHPHHWNQTLLLEVRQPLNQEFIQQALQQVLSHHDALRLRFEPTDTGWQQINSDIDVTVPFSYIDLSILAPEERTPALEKAATEIQASLSLLSSPLMRVALFDFGANTSSRLLIAIHHLVVDGVSWRILLEDLQTAYQQLCHGEPRQLPAKTTSFKQWAIQLQEYATSPELQAELEYWHSVMQQPTSSLPKDNWGGENTGAIARTISVSLNEAETSALLQTVPAAYGTQINDVLLAALAQTFAAWTGNRSLLVDLEGHGREPIFDEVDVSRTLGWFTSIFPVRLDLSQTSNLGEALSSIQAQLQSIPNRGIGYGILRYLNQNSAQNLANYPAAEVRFNYLGQSDQVLSELSLFGIASESCGTDRSLQNSRRYLLDISGIVTGGQLQLNWTYSEAIHQRNTVENLAEGFLKALRSLITHCQSFAKTLANASATPIYIETLADLNAEAVLDPTIRPATPFEWTSEPTAIFLTGATGFLGAFLLHELLHQTQADVYCLVRSPNLVSGKKRLQTNLEFYSLWDEHLSDRIIPVLGDLSQPLLGLSNEQFEHLAHQVDVIYHNGASINLVYPYSTLKLTNVLGTQEVLRLACRLKTKPVHLISTLSVVPSQGRFSTNIVWEDDDLRNYGAVPHNGYGQTKWVAEQLANIARSRGLPVCIYRPGRISGHSQTGVCNTNDRLYRMIKGCIQLGSVPDVALTMDMAPVDYMSQSIVHLSRQKEFLGKVFHLFNPHPIDLNQLVEWIRSFGYPLRQVSYNEWQTELFNVGGDSPDNALYPLIPFFSEKASEKTAESTVLQFDNQNTMDGLADTSIYCPPADAKLLHTYFSYLVKIGFLDAPPLQGKWSTAIASPMQK